MLRLLPILGLLSVTTACAALSNLALTGTASSSSLGYGAIAADGNDGNRDGTFGNGSVFHTLNEAGPSWWQVNLAGPRYLDHVRIFNRVDAIQGSVANFRLIAKLGATEVFNQVFLTSGATDANNCRAWGTSALRGVQADSVRLERVSNASPAVNFLTFAECEVWGSAALLPPKLTPVSVTGSPAGFSTAIGDANDGDINGNYAAAGSPVYHSAAQGVGQFWEMDLGTDFLVKSVLLFNRSEANGTQSVRVKLLDSAGAQMWSQDVNIALGTVTPFQFGFEREPNLGARKVRVETIASEFLMLAEVQAFGTVLTVIPPAVENVAATSITGSTAQTGANLTSTGFAPATVKLYYGNADGGTNAAAWASVAELGTQSANGIYPHQLTGLTPTTTYHLRAFAENSAGSDWADATATFTTPTAAPASLEMLPAIGITGSTALVNGQVTETGNDPPQVTIFWGPTDGGAVPANWASSSLLGIQSAAFGKLLTNLQPNSAYYLSARAANGGGTVWSPAIHFTTTAKNPVVINEVHYEPVDNTRNIEFIELWNPSDTAQDIGLWRLDGPVQFQFPADTVMAANSYRVVAASSVQFQSWFGVAPQHQWTAGRLRNSGDRIRLRDAAFAVVDDVDYAPGFPWPTSAAGAGPSIELISPGLENDTGGAWRNSTASPRPQTPGAANTALAVLAPPSISGVGHTPVTPAAGQAVVVSAKIEDRNGVASASLTYVPVNPGAYVRRTDAAYGTGWLSLPMNDAGADGDITAGDGIWSATVPASVQTHRRLIRYRISAADTLGGSVSVPYADDEQPNFAYFCYNGTPAWNGAMQPGAAGARGAVQAFSPALLDSFPPYHLIASGSDVTNSQYNSAFNDVRFHGTLVYDGKVYDHIQFKNRGLGSIYVSGKNKWALLFNRARNIRVKDNWGRYYDQTWNSMAMNANASPWCAVHRGMAGVEEAISYRIYELCGIPTLRTHYVHWRVIDHAVESGPTQFDGDLWGLYMGLEPMEGNFLDERDLPDGNLYNIQGYGPELRHQAATQPSDSSDWAAFASGTTAAGQTEAWYRANMDVPAFCTFQAINRFIGNIDIRPGDNYRAYHRPAAPLSDNRWVISPYDQDMMCLPGHHWGGSIDGVTYAGVTNQFHSITRHSAIALEFRNRCRELLDLLGSDNSPNGGQMAQLIEEYAQMVNPAGTALTWADADAHLWNLHPRTLGTLGDASGYTNHKNNFFKTPFADYRGAPIGSVTNWTRTLPDPDGDGYGDFEGLMGYLRDFHTNTWPGGTWARSNGNSRGYGYKYMEWESLYGGLGLNPAAPDLTFPNRPAITYTGAPGYPANGLDFQSSVFSPAAVGSTGFGAIQWRIGEISAPGIPGYVAGDPRRYEVEEVWTSAAITPFNASIRVPLSAARPGHTYRARVRHRDNNGRWSRWSEPVQFAVGVPDVSVYRNALVISEVNYNPAPTTQTERDAGFLDSDLFEWIEVKNVSDAPADMTGLRFTKGADFDFPGGWTIPAGGFALVVKDVNAFRHRWGSAHDAIIAGSYGSANLSNGGEEIKLSYGAGTEVRAFLYDDNAPWPAAADGTGSTLVLKSPGAQPDHTVAENWRASAAVGGSPGVDDLYTYALWSSQFPGIGDANANPDGDVLTNKLEYAFGGDPNIAGTAPITGALQHFPAAVPPGDYLTITFTRRSDAVDLTSTPQFSVDLIAWSAATALVSATTNPNGTVTETWRSSLPVNSTGRLYVRVQVE
jgi:hypothetical protein